MPCSLNFPNSRQDVRRKLRRLGLTGHAHSLYGGCARMLGKEARII
jgi:hypothetical protein